MVTTTQVLGFLLTALLLTATPGPDNLMVLSVGMAQGRRQGIAFGLGCATGCLSHTALAVLGVSAVIAASPLAFTALRWLGGAYLVVLGVRAWRATGRGAAVAPTEAAPARAAGPGVAPADRPGPNPPAAQAAATTPAAATPTAPLGRLFAQGLVANAINPKVGLFFLAFLPQFVLPAQGGIALQLGLLGLVFSLQAALLFGVLGWFAGAIGSILQRRPRAGRALDSLAATVFVALGLRMLASR